MIARPAVEPDLWSRFVSGALAAYRKHDVEVALEYSDMKSGESTDLFTVALAEDGGVVGGSRAIGPYTSADDTHAIVEWSEPDHRSEIRRVLGGCIREGLVEGKTGWVLDDAPQRRELTATIARSAAYYMDLLGARYMVNTAADNTMGMWQRYGATLVEEILPAPYPDARYRTRLLLWDARECDQDGRRRELTRILDSGSAR